MIVNMEGLSYEERLRYLKLWTLEERRNRQELIEVFKISRGKSIIGLQDLFTLDKNNKVTRGHTLKLSKMRCTWDWWKYFSLTEWLIHVGGTCWTSRELKLPASTPLKWIG